MPKNTQKILAKTIGMYLNMLSYIYPEKGFSLAYAFFSQPRKGKLKKDKLPKMLLHAEQETHFHNQHQFQTYTWKGNDEVILLILLLSTSSSPIYFIHLVYIFSNYLPHYLNNLLNIQFN